MVKITKNPDEIIIRYIPVKQWILAGLLTLLFGIFFVWLIFSTIFNPQDITETKPRTWIEMIPIIAFSVAIGLISIFEIKLFSVIRAPLITFTINQTTKSIDVSSRRFYGKENKRFYFSQISKVKSYKEKRLFFERYFLTLILANQKEIKLEIPTGDKQATINLVKKINKFTKPKISRI